MPDPALGLLPGCALRALAASDAADALRRLAGVVVDAGHAAGSFVDAVVARERRFPTGLPTAVPCAIPHTDPEHVLRAGLAVATLAEPVSFAKMGMPNQQIDVRLIVMLCVTDPQAQVASLQGVLGRLRDVPAIEALLAHDDDATFPDAVSSWLAG